MKKIFSMLSIAVALAACSQPKNEKAPAEVAKSEEVATSTVPKELAGNWFTPHAAIRNITFNADETYEFALGDSTKQKGKFSLKNDTLTLVAADNTVTKLTFTKGKDGDQNFYIKSLNDAKSTEYFVKSN